MRMLARPLFSVAIALLATASQAQAGPVAKVIRSSGEPTSVNPVCAVNVSSARTLADHGDLASARKLRAYYWDCVNSEYERGLKRWGETAAVLGGKVDENEYLRILLEFRFERSGSEWASPEECDRRHTIEGKYGSVGKGLAVTHRQIVYRVNCERSGIGHGILLLAAQAAKRGGVEDAKFYSDLLRVKRRQSQRQ